MKELKLNTFIAPIIHKKKKHDFKAWMEKRKVIKDINNGSPSFATLWEISDFLMILRECYCYDNDSNFNLFLASLPKGSQGRDKARAMVYKEKGFSIKFLLQLDQVGQLINIEITRNGQNNSSAEKISFYDGQYQFKDIYDQEKFLFITSCIMSGCAALVNYYYKHKRF